MWIVLLNFSHVIHAVSFGEVGFVVLSGPSL